MQWVPEGWNCTDVCHSGFAGELMWSKSKSLPRTHWTSCQSAGTALWDPHYSSPRRWERPMCLPPVLPSLPSFPFPFPLLSAWVEVVGFLLLTWSVDSSRRTLWWCGNNQITPFALAGGLLYSCFPGKTCGQQGPFSTGRDTKGSSSVFSTFYLVRGSVLVRELKHGLERWVSIYRSMWHNGLSFLLRQISIKISTLPTSWWNGFNQLKEPLLPQLWKGPGDGLYLGHWCTHSRH